MLGIVIRFGQNKLNSWFLVVVAGVLFLNVDLAPTQRIRVLMEGSVTLIHLYTLSKVIILYIAEQMKQLAVTLPPLVIPRLAPNAHLQRIRAV